MKVLRSASENVFVLFLVGGGIRDFTDANGRVIFLYSHLFIFLVIPDYFIFVKVFLLAFGFRYYTSLEVASEYFRSGADKVSIGSDAVFAAEEYLCTEVCFLQMCYLV